MMANSSENQKIVLLGYMGSGKSTVGQHLADRLQIPFIDLDDYITREAGKSITEIFNEKGEIRFRKLESEALGRLMKRPEQFVLALGGGTPCFAGNMEMIEQDKLAVSFYLKHSLGHLVKRLWPERAHRPMIAHLSDEELLDDFVRKHLFERGFYYNRADHILDCDDRSVEPISTEIVELIK